MRHNYCANAPGNGHRQALTILYPLSEGLG